MLNNKKINFYFNGKKEQGIILDTVISAVEVENEQIILENNRLLKKNIKCFIPCTFYLVEITSIEYYTPVLVDPKSIRGIFE